jgi:DNA repair exonuclease SbcCD ATPase subunit
MEFEQIVKRLDWLDEEYRKNKATIAVQVEHIATLSATIKTLEDKTKSLEKEMTNYAALKARVDQFDEFLAQVREEMGENLGRLEKSGKEREKELIERFEVQIPPLKEAITDIRSKIDVSDIRRDLKVRESEELRLSASFTELKAKFDDVIRSNKDLQHGQTLYEENRRQDQKRFADAQGEIVALRKRLDEERDKQQLNIDNLKNIDTRVSEVLAGEHKRKQEQAEFVDKQMIQYADRERIWNEWLEKADNFEAQTELLDTELQKMNEAMRATKKAEESYAEISQKIERRVHEITEMQRLAEDRLRQEWVTFKSDDQKRWTGYGLSQDETMKQLQKTLAKLEERMVALDDSAQTMQDKLEQTSDVTEHQMQELMNWAHEWLTAYERVMGHTKKSS